MSSKNYEIISMWAWKDAWKQWCVKQHIQCGDAPEKSGPAIILLNMFPQENVNVCKDAYTKDAYCSIIWNENKVGLQSWYFLKH